MHTKKLYGGTERSGTAVAEKEHQAFADHVKLLEKQPLTGENASAMLDEILTYLVRWLYRHILSSDMMIGKMQKEDPFVFTAKYYTELNW